MVLSFSALSIKPKQALRIIGEDQLAGGGIWGPITEHVVELDCADLVVERQMRKITAPQQLAGRSFDQGTGERLDVGKNLRSGDGAANGCRQALGHRKRRFSALIR